MPTSDQALSALGLSSMFGVLGVSAAIWDGSIWRAIHVAPSAIVFEVEHGVESKREKHNERCMRRAWNERQPVLGNHAGLSDLYVPVVVNDRTVAVLVTGPFATTRATTVSVLERWHWLTGRPGHPSDPEFAHFLTVALKTLTLEGKQVEAFTKMVKLLADQLAGEDGSRAEEGPLRSELERARQVERMWEAARSMLDEPTSRSWLSSYRQPWQLGLRHLPEQALVGLIVSRDREPDSLDDLLRRDALQRSCARLARATKNVVAGQVGDHGVMFLSAASGGARRNRQMLVDLGTKATRLARDLGFRLHIGLSSGRDSSLRENFQAALAAAESALSRGARLVDAATETVAGTFVLMELERELGELFGRDPATLPPHFDRYLETVALHCSYRLEFAAAHLRAAFERLAATLLERGALDAATLRNLSKELAAKDARTVVELSAAYRRALLDLAEAVRHPSNANRDRSLRRALDYIHQHYLERLSLRTVARVAGFAPNYFSALFKKREHMTFERYIQRRRIERAKLLLRVLELDVQQVAHLAGFRDRHYFGHAFKRACGMTPLEYRRAPS